MDASAERHRLAGSAARATTICCLSLRNQGAGPRPLSAQVPTAAGLRGAPGEVRRHAAHIGCSLAPTAAGPPTRPPEKRHAAWTWPRQTQLQEPLAEDGRTGPSAWMSIRLPLLPRVVAAPLPRGGLFAAWRCPAAATRRVPARARRACGEHQTRGGLQRGRTGRLLLPDPYGLSEPSTVPSHSPPFRRWPVQQAAADNRSPSVRLHSTASGPRIKPLCGPRNSPPAEPGGCQQSVRFRQPR